MGVFACLMYAKPTEEGCEEDLHIYMKIAVCLFNKVLWDPEC